MPRGFLQNVMLSCMGIHGSYLYRTFSRGERGDKIGRIRKVIFFLFEGLQARPVPSSSHRTHTTLYWSVRSWRKTAYIGTNSVSPKENKNIEKVWKRQRLVIRIISEHIQYSSQQGQTLMYDGSRYHRSQHGATSTFMMRLKSKVLGMTLSKNW